MNIKDILALIAQLGLGAFIVFWIYHIVQCFRRPDYRIFDKIFWFLVLLIPIVGLIMYRGIGNEFYKDRQ